MPSCGHYKTRGGDLSVSLQRRGQGSTALTRRGIWPEGAQKTVL